MNICFLVSSLNDGGAERVATTLCNAWAGRGDAITLIPTYSRRGACFYTVSPAVELLYLADHAGPASGRAWAYGKRLRALRRLIAERKPDVVISFLSNVNVAAILSCAFLRVPVIVCERVDPSFRYPWLLTALCKATYRFADVLTVQTDSVAGRAVNFYPGLRKVHSIPNPLPEAVAQAEPVRCGERRILLSAGRLVQQKQPGRLLEAFAEAAPYFPEWDLHIYGDGPLKSELEQQSAAAGLRDRIVFKGATASLWDAMAGADAFAMVSSHEGFPNALLEAMGIGLPCAVFDCPSGPREITRNGEDALLIPLNDHDALVEALSKLMGNEDLRKRLGAQARDSVRSRFSLSEVLGKWDQLFDELGIVR